MPKVLNTPISPWTAIFRRIVSQLEADETIKNLIVPANIRSFTRIDDKQPFDPQPDSPAIIRLTPQPDNISWFSPDAQSGSLLVLVETCILTNCIDDTIDLWQVIVRALIPGGPSDQPGGTDFAQDLVALGAITGEIAFSDPAAADHPEMRPATQFYGHGYLKLDVQFSIL